MKKYKGYLIDLDGTVYKGNSKIETAVPFINELAKKGVPYLFVTNSSIGTQQHVSDKLNKMGIECSPDQVITSGYATAKYIKNENPDARCMVIGEKGVTTAFEGENITMTKENIDYVVMGTDRKINYEKYVEACLAIRAGAKFISTNSDAATPTERGLVPGNGALTSVVITSTGVQPTLIGKPEKHIMDVATEVLNLPKEDLVMVGDNYDTDISAGINAGIDTLLVFTGYTQKEDLKTIIVQPTNYVNDLTEWI